MKATYLPFIISVVLHIKAEFALSNSTPHCQTSRIDSEDLNPVHYLKDQLDKGAQIHGQLSGKNALVDVRE